MRLIEALEDQDDVDTVHANFDVDAEFWSASPGDRASGGSLRQPRTRSTWSPIALFLIAADGDRQRDHVARRADRPDLPRVAARRLAASRAWARTCSILLGLPVGMVVVGKLLGALDRCHGRRHRPPTTSRRSARLDEVDARRARPSAAARVLDKVMIISVGVALVLFGDLVLRASPAPRCRAPAPRAREGVRPRRAESRA